MRFHETHLIFLNSFSIQLRFRCFYLGVGMRDRETLDEMAGTIAREIDAAAMDQSPWVEICKRLVGYFPGSYATILNQNFIKPEFNFQAVDNLEADHLHSYLRHYAFINPWNTFWKFAPSGSIIVSQRDYPASQFRNGEFYTDWMAKTGDFEAGTGLKLQIDKAETIYLPVHYGLNLSNDYDRELEFLLAKIRPALENALQFKRALRQMGETASARAAIVGSASRIALVVDHDGYLKEANPLAAAAFSKGSFISCRGSEVRFLDSKLSEQVKEVCRRLGADRAYLAPKLTSSTEGHLWLVTFLRLPEIFVSGLVASRTLILIQITDVYHPIVHPDMQLISDTFNLTRTEGSLCLALSVGMSLADAATENRISYENARQRLKNIFQKTETRSQAELRVLLAQF